MKVRQQKLLIVVGVIVAVALLMWLALSGGNMEILKIAFTQDLSDEQLRDHLQGFGWRGGVAIIALSALQVLCTVVPAEPVQVLAGVTFGFPIGLSCCMIGVMIGHTLIYLLQKLYGDRLRGFFVKTMNLDLEAISQSGKAMLIIWILYFLPAIPYGMIAFIAASLGLSYRRYFLVALLGAIPSEAMGVALGHVSLVSSWMLSVGILVVILVLMAIVFYKKDVLFERLNRYANRLKNTPKNRVRPVNRLLLAVLYAAIRFYLFLCGVRLKTANKVGKIEGPAIVLCNHGSFIDFIYAAALLRKFSPHFIVARLYFYNNILGTLLRHLGAFPKSMFAMDMENAKNCLTVLKEKEVLAMMPEARLSTAGRFEDIQGSTAAFLKKAGVNLYTIKICGDYLADPKWGKGFRRGSVVEAELDILYTAEQVKDLTQDQLQEAVEQRLRYDELQWLQQRPQIRYRSGRMAEGLENILTTCPQCGRKHTLTTRKNKVYCEHCGYLTSMDQRYAFEEAFQFENFTQWYDWQKALLEREIAQNPDYSLSSKVELRLPGTGMSLTRPGGSGVCTLSRDGLTYVGTKDGENVQLHFSLKRIYRLLFGAGQNFEIYDGTEILYFVPEERRSAVEWYMASMILHDEAAVP